MDIIVIIFLFIVAAIVAAYLDLQHDRRKREEKRQAEACRREQERQRREEERRRQQEQRKLQVAQQKQREAERKRREYEEAERIKKAEQRRKKQEDKAARDAKEAQMSEQRRYIAQERRKMKDTLRYDVMMRDGFRCVLCGATQADGVKLHVDHIVPLAKGGKTELSNLRTLCERCNMGKRDKIEVVLPLAKGPSEDINNAQTISPDEFVVMLNEVSREEYENAELFMKVLASRHIPYIDKRASGGCLWIKASEENDRFLSSVRVSGVGLEYAKTTRNFSGPGWFIK